MICGIDGSGKTTIARLLVKYLIRRESTACYIWFRWRSFFLYALYVYSRIKGLYRAIRKLDGYCTRIHFIEADKVLSVIYPYVLSVDLVISYILQRFMYVGCDMIVYDRGPLDTLVDLYYLRWRSGNKLERILIKFYILFTIKITRKIVVLTASERTILRRKRDILSLTELQFKNRLYIVLARLLDIYLIDTSSRNIAQVFNEVKEILL